MVIDLHQGGIVERCGTVLSSSLKMWCSGVSYEGVCRRADKRPEIQTRLVSILIIGFNMQNFANLNAHPKLSCKKYNNFVLNSYKPIIFIRTFAKEIQTLHSKRYSKNPEI